MPVYTSHDDKSKGHVAFVGKWELFTTPNGDLFRAPIDDYSFIDTFGYRNCARFECTAGNAARAIARITAEQTA